MLRIALKPMRRLGLSILLIFGREAIAQTPVTCTAAPAVAALARSDGATELMPDLLVSCTGGSGSAAIPWQFNLFLTTTVTSRVENGISEALVQTGSNSFHATQAGGNSLQWNFQLPPPGGAVTTFRFTNIRANVALVGGSSFFLPAVSAAVVGSINGQSWSAPTVILAYAIQPVLLEGKRCDDGGPTNYVLPAYGGLNPGLANPGGTGSIQMNLKFVEQWPQVFGTASQESGTVLSGSDLGMATQGVRLKASLNVPAGFRVFVTTSPVNTGSATSPTVKAVLTKTETSVLSPVAPTVHGACLYDGSTWDMAEVPALNGFAEPVWEVTGSSRSLAENLSFGVAFSYQTLPLGQTVRVTGTLAPTTSPSPSSASLLYPSFVDFEQAFAQTGTATQTNLSFTAVVGGGKPPTQDLYRPPGGNLATVISVTTTDGAKWLSAKANGDVVTAAVDNSVLTQPGDYYGKVVIPGFTTLVAGQNVQVSGIFLHLLPTGQDPGPVIQPQGLLFAAFTSETTTDSQTVTVTNITAKPILFADDVGTGIANPGVPVSIPLKFGISGLAPGVYTTTFELSFSSGQDVKLPVKAIVSPLPKQSSRPTTDPKRPYEVRALSATARQFRPADFTASCPVPSSLVVQATQVGLVSLLNVGYPQLVQASVFDNCSQPLAQGTVTATFSTNDQPVRLYSSGAGVWSGNWSPRFYAASVTVTITATSLDGTLTGTNTATRSLSQDTQVPLFTPGSVISTASGTTDLAPGTAFSIMGSRLAGSSASSPAYPAPSELAGTQVFVGLEPVPLTQVSDGRIDGILPFDVQPGSTYQLFVQRGDIPSAGLDISFQAVSPEIFSQSGPGSQGQILDSATGKVANTSAPAAAGDALQIFCSGLGPFTPDLAAGTLPPTGAAEQLAGGSVTVSIAGVNANVTAVGLAPSMVGVYVVNTALPGGLGQNSAAPVVISMAGVSSPAVTMAIR